MDLLRVRNHEARDFALPYQPFNIVFINLPPPKSFVPKAHALF